MRLSNFFVAAVVLGTILQSGITLPASAQVTGQGQFGNPIIVRPGFERHPEMRAALRSLLRARQELQLGAHDFNGDRVRALQLTDQAIAELRAGLRFDRR